MHTKALVAFMAALSPAAANAIVGFNYGANYTNGTVYAQPDFQSMFSGAQKLAGTNGMFTAARLYTTIQGGSTSDPTSAIPAAIATKTRLLLGLWASSGSTTMTNEINALMTAIKKYGSAFTDLVEGISVGSEDLYRITSTSLSFDPTSVGAEPNDIVNYITQLRQALKGTALSNAKIGHVDTWSVWTNSSNNAVIQACDWIGTDAYPYFETGSSNGIDQGKSLFDDAWKQAQDAVQGKDVWVTETGWPLSGATENQAVASTSNAQQYWQSVGCGELFGKVNTYWFNYFDQGASPGFGLVDAVGGTPKFDLTCNKSAASSGAPNATDSSNSSNSSGSSSGSSFISTSGSGSPSNSSSSSSSLSPSSSSISSGSSSISGSSSTTPTSSGSAASSTRAVSAGVAPLASWTGGVAAVLAALLL